MGGRPSICHLYPFMATAPFGGGLSGRATSGAGLLMRRTSGRRTGSSSGLLMRRTALLLLPPAHRQKNQQWRRPPPEETCAAAHSPAGALAAEAGGRKKKLGRVGGDPRLFLLFSKPESGKNPSPHPPSNSLMEMGGGEHHIGACINS